jgi:Ion channel
MEVEVPQMLMPFIVAMALFACGLLSYGMAIHLVVRMLVTLILSGYREPGFWKGIATMAIVTLITAAVHLTQIALWAVAFLLCGQISTWETAFYYSAQNYTALGYGDIQLSGRWRLLGPLEALNGLLFLGLSTAVLFAIMRQLIANRLRTETGNPREAAGNQAPLPVDGDAWWR